MISLPVGLRHTAGDRNHHATPIARGGLLHLADTADLGIDLIDSLFTDVTGVEDDEIGVLGPCGLDEPLGLLKALSAIR